jgi:2-polyprenyl-6-methoxyphenol hydroxylase-like FAD-dependent oxidoreductase
VSRDLRIAIVGFGIAGAALALLLGRRGYAINCFERSDVGVDGGAGLLLAPPALTLLRSLGLEEEIRRRGSVVSALRATTTDGKVLLNWHASHWGYSCLGLGVQRRSLHDVLSRAAAGEMRRLHRGIELAAVDSLRGVLVDTRGERFGPFDLVLACDGAGSTLRDALPARCASMNGASGRWRRATSDLAAGSPPCSSPRAASRNGCASGSCPDWPAWLRWNAGCLRGFAIPWKQSDRARMTLRHLSSVNGFTNWHRRKRRGC